MEVSFKRRASGVPPPRNAIALVRSTRAGGRTVGTLRIGSRCQLLNPARPARAGRVVVGVLPKGVSSALTPPTPPTPLVSRAAEALRAWVGRSRTVTPRAATHSPQPVLPSSPARSQTGKPGTAVARTSPWLSREKTLTKRPGAPRQRGSTRAWRENTLRGGDQPLASRLPGRSPS